MPSYLWKPEWSKEVSTQLSALLREDRAAVFKKIASLAAAENPYAVPGVEKLWGRRFQDKWKMRHGNFRILFVVEVRKITHLKHQYRGRLVILSVDDRRDAYRKRKKG